MYSRDKDSDIVCSTKENSMQEQIQENTQHLQVRNLYLAAGPMNGRNL